MRFLRVIAVVFGILLILVAGFLLYLHTSGAKARVAGYLQTYFAKTYGLKISIGKLDYDLLPIFVTAHDLRIAGGAQNEKLFFQAKTIEIGLTYSSFWSNTFHIRKLSIQNPEVLPDDMPRFSTTKSGSGIFQIDEIVIENGRADFSQQKIQNIHSRLTASSKGIKVDKLRANFAGANVSVSGGASLEPSLTYEFRYEITGDASTLKRFDSKVPAFTGPVYLGGTLTGSKDDYQIKGFFEAKEVRTIDRSLFYAGGNYDLRPTRNIPYQLDLTLKDLPASVLGEFLPSLPQLATSLSGTFRYAGGSDPWTADSTFYVNLTPNRGKGTIVEGELDGSIRNGKIFLDGSDLTSGKMSATFSAQLTRNGMQAHLHTIVPSAKDLQFLNPTLGRIPGSYVVEADLAGAYENIGITGNLVGKGPQFSVELDGAYSLGSNQLRASGKAKMDAASLDQNLSGPLYLEGTISGTAANPVIQAHIQGDDLLAYGKRLGTLDAAVGQDGRNTKFEANLPDLLSALNGVYNPYTKELVFHGDVRDLTLEQIRDLLPGSLQQTSGRITATLDAAFRLPNWESGKAKLAFQEAHLERNGILIELENSDVSLENHQFIANLNLRTTDGAAAITGTVPVDTTLPIHLEAEGEASLSLLRFVTSEFIANGLASFNITASGRRQNPSLSGEITGENFELLWPSQKIVFHGDEVKTAFAGQQITIEGSGKINISRDDIKGNSSVIISASGKGANPEAWTGSIRLNPENLLIGETALTFTRPAEVSLQQNTIRLAQVQLRAGDLIEATVSGTWDLKTKAIRSELQSNADLSLLSTFYPDIQAGGNVKLTGVVSGTSELPKFSGSVQIDNGLLQVPGYPMVFERIHLIAPVEKEGMRIDTLTASLGGGSVQASGKIGWNQNEPDSTDIRLQAKGAAINYPENFKSILNADLSFHGGKNRYLLSGQVDVRQSAYREDIDPRGRLVRTLLKQKKSLLPQADSFSNRVALEIDLKTIRDTLIENSMGRLRVSGNLRVGGTLNEPLLNGRLQVKEGSYVDFEGQTYTVDEANLDYRGTEILNPRLQIQLLTEVEHRQTDGTTRLCDIKLNLTGSLTSPEINPTSNACNDLEDYQIYSLLLTGSTEVKDASSAFFANQLAAFLTGTVLYDFQRTVTRGLGLQTFSIEPLLIASESNPGARMTLGKRLTREIDLAYSLSLSESTDQIWLANYRIRNNFQLRLIDQEDTLTTSLRHRFQFGSGGSKSALDRSTRFSRRQTVGVVEIQNDTLLSEPEIRKKLPAPGDRYDFWRVQQAVDYFKQELQDAGYLFPKVEVQESSQDETSLRLQINLANQGKRNLVITGTEFDSSRKTKYFQWWREGFSEMSVLTQIENDLKESLWNRGYFKATVDHSTENVAGVITYRFDVQAGAEWKGKNLILSGLRSLPEQEFQDRLRSLYLSRNEMISEAIHRFPQMARNISALFAEQGYLQTRVRAGETKYDSPDGTVDVEILIEEGRRSYVSDLKISDNQNFPDELRNQLVLKEDEVYFPLQLQDDQKTALNYYRSHGYWGTTLSSTVEAVPNSPNVQIKYDLTAGSPAVIHSVQIQGKHKTRESLIRKELKLQEGELLTDELLSQAQDRLYDLRVFDNVSMVVEPAGQEGMYDVIVEVLESKKYEVMYGGRYDTEDDFEGEAQITDQNFLGLAHSLFFYSRLNNAELRYQLGYGSPSLFGWNWNAFFLAERVDFSELDLVQTNFTFQQQNDISDRFHILSGYRYTRNKTTLTIPGEDVPQEFIIAISRLQATAFADYRDNPIDATRGFFASSGLEYAPDFLGSFQTFLKSYSQFYYYHPVSRFTAASAIRVGLATTFAQEFLLTPERFFAGGGDTLRGFRFDEVGPRDVIFNEPLGGEAVLILNEELRFPVYWWFRGAVFYDVGNVFNEITDFSFSDLRHSAGFGLRLALPNGLIGRFDIGFNLDPLEDEPQTVYHFSFGQAF